MNEDVVGRARGKGRLSGRAFGDAVSKRFRPVLRQFGLAPVVDQRYRVRFERSPVFVEVDYDAGRSLELTVWVGEDGRREPPFALPDLLRGTDCPPDQVAEVELLQPRDVATLDRLLDRSLDLLVEFGRRFLDGDPAAFAQARALRSERARRYTREVWARREVEAADAAWNRQDYVTVHALLDPIRDVLDEPHLRRLDFARRRADRTKP